MIGFLSFYGLEHLRKRLRASSAREAVALFYAIALGVHFLTALGTLAMVMGTIEYWQSIKALRRFQPIAFARPSMVMALVMSIGGVFLFFSIITGLF